MRTIAFLLLGVLALPAFPQSKPDKEWTLKEIRNGLEALRGQVSTQDLRFARMPAGCPEAEVRADHPDRTEYHFIWKDNLNFWLTTKAYQNAVMTVDMDETWNGKKASREERRNPSRELNEIYYDRLPPPVENFTGTYVGFERKGFHGLIDKGAVRVLGRPIVDGAKCIRLLIDFSFADRPPMRHIIDVDPNKSFWHRVSKFGVPDKADGFSQEIIFNQFSDFRKVGEVYFPHRLRHVFSTQREQVYLFTSVKLGEQVQDNKFFIQPKIGMTVHDHVENKMFVAGGEEGAEMRRKSIASRLKQTGTKPASSENGQPVSANAQAIPIHWILLATAAATVIGIIILRRRV